MNFDFSGQLRRPRQSREQRVVIATKKRCLYALCTFLCVITNSSVVLAAGNYRIVSGENEVCQVAAPYIDFSLPREELPFESYGFRRDGESIVFQLPSGLGATPLVDFDFDNDGITDRVFSREEAGSYIFGTILFVAFGRNDERVVLKKDALTVADVKIFPCQFDQKIISSSSCPMISQGADEAGITISIGSTPPILFRGRYTMIEPIRYKNRTYLLLRGTSSTTKAYGGVIEPTGSTSYRPVCLYKKR